MNRTTVLLATLVLVGVGGCSTTPSTPTAQVSTDAAVVDDGAPASDVGQSAQSGQSAQGEVADQSASLACARYRNLMDDASNGLYANDDAAALDQIRQIEVDAGNSRNYGVGEASLAMLTSASSGDTALLTTASTWFGATCDALR